MDLSFEVLDKGKPLLCLDFDGVLHRYSRGYEDGSVYDIPTKGAQQFVKEASEHFNLCIYSSRARTEKGKLEMLEWLLNNKFPHLEIVCEKPPAFLTLDDRAITFTGIFPKAEELLKFTAWNGKPWGTKHI